MPCGRTGALTFVLLAMLSFSSSSSFVPPQRECPGSPAPESRSAHPPAWRDVSRCRERLWSSLGPPAHRLGPPLGVLSPSPSAAGNPVLSAHPCPALPPRPFTFHFPMASLAWCPQPVFRPAQPPFLWLITDTDAARYSRPTFPGCPRHRPRASARVGLVLN